MSFAARNVLRLTRTAAPAARFSASTGKAARSFTTTRINRVNETTNKKSVVREKEVPASVYEGTGPGEKHTVHVPEGAAKIPHDSPQPPPEHDEVQPLSKKAYEGLPHTMKQMTVFGKTIIVTGGARGLGNHMARACAEAGAKNIIIFDANQQLGDEAAAELHQKSGIPVSFFKVDVRDGAAINAALDSVVDIYGAPDALVNAAGIADSNIKAETYDPAMFRRLIDINLTGTFSTLR